MTSCPPVVTIVVDSGAVVEGFVAVIVAGKESEVPIAAVAVCVGGYEASS